MEGGDDGDVPIAVVDRARSGDADALDTVIRSVRDRVYHLSLRMTACPDDAEDATQEILIKVITRLGSFRAEARFTTWVHRVAVNHLLDRKRSTVEREEMSFDDFANDLRVGRATRPSERPDAELLAEEVRLSCTRALLVCLDRDHRVAYVLGEIFDVDSEEAAEICGVSPTTYRKRLSRARQRVRSFVERECGRVNPDAACRCSLRVDTAVRLGRIDPATVDADAVRRGVADMEYLSDVAGLMRAHPPTPAPAAITERLTVLIASGRYGVLS